MTASDYKLIAGALEHFVHDNPGGATAGEIDRLNELIAYFWGEAEEAQAKIDRAYREAQRGKQA